MMASEVPFLIAGTVAVVGGFAREGHWPANGTKAVMATGAMVLVASVADRTALEPFVAALGWLAVFGAVYAATPALTARKRKG
jgi:hypothetical protein